MSQQDTSDMHTVEALEELAHLAEGSPANVEAIVEQLRDRSRLREADALARAARSVGALLNAYEDVGGRLSTSKGEIASLRNELRKAVWYG
jgi:hypothetical protein